MNNQQKFNELSAKIFGQLYDSFPLAIELTFKDYPEEDHDLLSATLEFYINEKFIRCNERYYGIFSGLVLTSKGFSVLNAKPPENFKNTSNLATALKEAIANGKTELIKTLVAEAIKLALHWAIP